MKKIISLFALMICAGVLRAQDIHFSQYYTLPINLNPGIAGFTECDYRVSSSYRNQWGSVTTPFSTKFVSYDMSVWEAENGNSLGAGLSFFNDKAGTAAMGLTNINLSASYAFRISKKTVLSPGISAAWNQRSLNIGGLKWDNQYDGVSADPSLPSGEAGAAPYRYFDYATGVMLKTRVKKDEVFQFGLSALHLNMPRYSFGGTGDRLSIRYVGFTSYEKFLKEKNYIVPSALIMKQGPAMEITAGLMYKIILGMDSKYTGENVSSYVMFGGAYRLKDAIVLSFYYDYKHKAGVGLSYDINLSGLSSVTTGRGGPEISLFYKGFLSERSNRKKASVRFN